MQLPMANATLTTVTAAGETPDYDHGGGPGAEKWTGSEGVYFHERTERIVEGASSSVVVTRSVVVADDIVIDWTQGDTLTLTHAYSGDTVSVVIRAVQRSSFPGAPGIVRLTLEDG